MCFIVNDEDFRCDWFISGECECALVNGFLLTVRSLLICAVRYELKDLQVVFPLGFHAVDTVPEDYLCQYGYCFRYSSGAVSWVAEHFCHFLCGSVMRFVSKTKAPLP